MKISRFSLILAALTALSLCGCVQKEDVKIVKTGTGVDDLPQPLGATGPMNNVYVQLSRETASDVGEDFDPFVTPDGKSLLFASTKFSTKSDIFLKNVTGRAVEQITHTPNANEKQPQMSPDGKCIIYASDKEGKYDIYEISAQHKGAREMELVRNGRINEQPCYSRDGTKIAYVTWDPRKNEWWIAVMDRKTQKETLCGPGLFPRFSPDGKKILFQKARVRMPQWFSIWILDLETESVSEIVSNDSWAAITPNWSPDGTRIVFASVCKSSTTTTPLEADDIYTIWADGSHLIRITDDDTPEWSPVWVESGKSGKIFFVSRRNSFQNIWSILLRDMDPFHPDTVEKAGAGESKEMPSL